MRHRLFASIFTITMLLGGSTALADVSDDCHILGGLHVEWDDLDPNQTIPVCNAAVVLDPEDGYLAFLLGRALNRNNDFAGALAVYGRAHRLGNAEATTNIGYMYLFGEGVRKDEARAWALFRDAMFRHSSTVTVATGVVYEHGLGFEKDLRRAGEIYTLAAKMGDRQAMINLGNMLWLGKGIEKNPEMAITSYEMASAAGSGKAQMLLAQIYRDGNGVQADPYKAAFYYERALISGSRAAADEVATNWKMFPVEVAKALQVRLTKSAQFDGEIDGQLTQETAAAIDRIFNTARVPPRKITAKPKEPTFNGGLSDKGAYFLRAE